MSNNAQVKKDYITHHLPARRMKVSDISKEKPEFTTTSNPVASRGMTKARKIGAAIICLGHVVTLWCIYDLFFNLHWQSALKWFISTFFFHWATGIPGITAGVHRLWAHRTYKANLPARIILAFFNTIANQSSIIHWSMEHRVHHRHVDTDADPHNINRGFFWCHMGWLFSPRTDAFVAARKEIDDSDLISDPVAYYQDKYYAYLGPLCCYVLPGFLGLYLYGDYWRGVAYLGFFRWIMTLHITWCVNSVAHTFGPRPYRPEERATENGCVSFFSGGEGWHNYHHAFPWDYAASEDRSDLFWRFNMARGWIDTFAALGWVTERKVQRNPFGSPISKPEEAILDYEKHD